MYPTSKFCLKGYVHHRRGFAVSRYGTRDVAYVLNLQDTLSGKRLLIETLVKDGNGEFLEGRILSPNIPYRVSICDPNLSILLASRNRIDNIGGYLTYNPGETITSITTASFGPSTTTPFIQLNLSRDALALINEQTDPYYYFVKESMSEVDALDFYNIGALAGVIKYQADDVRASILVKNDGDYDDLYISVTTCITMQGFVGSVPWWAAKSSYSTSTDKKNMVQSYSIPLMFRLRISRNILHTPSITTLALTDYRYLIPITNELKKIDSTKTDIFDDNSSNYNLIPGSYFAGSTRYAMPGVSIWWTATEQTFIPSSYGCMWDSVLDEVNSRIVAISAHGVSNASNIREERVNLLTFDLSSFNMGFERQNINIDLGLLPNYTSVSRLAGDINGDKILFGVTYFGWTSSNCKLYMIDSALSISSLLITGINELSVCKASDKFAIGGEGTNENPPGITVFTTPLISTMMSWPVGSTVAFASLANMGFLKLGKLPLETPAFFPPIFGLLAYVNVLGEDRSFTPNSLNTATVGRFIREIFEGVIEVVATNFGFAQGGPAAQKPLFTYAHFGINGGEIPGITIPLGPASFGESGFTEHQFFRLYMDYNYTNYYGSVNTMHIQRFDTQVLNLNGTPTFGYWANPTFGEGFRGGEGVFVTFILNNCSGVFRSVPGTAGWNALINGVPLDTIRTRGDISHDFGGDYNAFVTSTGNYNYWATIKTPTWNLSLNYDGQELVLPHDTSCSFVNYNVNGIMGIHIHTYLDLEGVTDGENRPYTDSSFALSGVNYNLTINTPDQVKTIGTVNLIPLSPNASIDTAVSYKTISNSVPFTMTRDLDTTINNVHIDKNGVLQTTLSSYGLTDATSATIIGSLENAIKGDYISIGYRPLYRGARGPEEPYESRRITQVSGHMYYLENVKIWVDGLDKTDEITDQTSTWLYIKPGATDIPIGITFDVKHEDFAQEAYADLTKVYPTITDAYMFVTKVISNPRTQPSIVNGQTVVTRYEKVPPNNSPSTYPNCTQLKGEQLFTKYSEVLATDSDYTDTNSHSGDIELTGESLSAVVKEDGKYQVYVIIKDQFSQWSAWCITNVHNNYRIPFGG